MKPITGNLTNDVYPIIFTDLYWDYIWDDIDFKHIFFLFDIPNTYILHDHLHDEFYASKILNKLFKKLH